ncbi:MAG: phosphatidate cytidylyltransferase [Thermanaeromonas sp.]|uniref:phosphatidate cytidylyltransferase n=1 Tax=Thermanaeromonas sp. TaxID=2003697 RepID=UPI00243F5FCB|nr:phosphatidate cytidylyltransferase [Thermanaeromonas sp.]MCG0277246.1 phosphatidate cytidylyltransferase [Thermanaeromonas sp.]
MLWARLLVAVAGIPLLLWVAYLGSLWLLGAVGIISLLGFREYCHLVRRWGLKPPVLLGYLGVLTTVAVVYWQREFSPYVTFILLWIFLGGFLLQFPYYSLADIAVTFLGCLYVSGSLVHLFLLRAGSGGSFGLLLYTFVLTWISDTSAYFIGQGLGFRRLCPVLSPHKTWEGAVGAGFVTLVAGALLGFYLFSLEWRAVVISLLAALAAQVGDLIESGMKRMAQVKDSGHLLPGHGGILDRFDSMMLVAPVVYYVWKLLG